MKTRFTLTSLALASLMMMGNTAMAVTTSTGNFNVTINLTGQCEAVEVAGGSAALAKATAESPAPRQGPQRLEPPGRLLEPGAGRRARRGGGRRRPPGRPGDRADGVPQSSTRAGRRCQTGRLGRCWRAPVRP